jgi:polyisoprenoid-binding protein YceI
MATTEITRDYEGSTIPVAGTYAFDPVHTSVGFHVRHMMVAKVRGRFAAPTGMFVIADDPLRSNVEVSIDAATVDTGEPARDTDLKSPNFLDVLQYPTISFKSTEVRHIKGDVWELVGDLTIHAVTKPVTLNLEVMGAARDPYGNTKIGFEATAKINREDWGLTYNAILETGGVMVSKDVTIDLAVEAASTPDPTGT